MNANKQKNIRKFRFSRFLNSRVLEFLSSILRLIVSSATKCYAWLFPCLADISNSSPEAASRVASAGPQESD
jgi:hypothetical protein